MFTKIIRITLTAGIIILAGLGTLQNSALAQTPDGQTPATESVCDPLKVDGITKGLYGLCVAYCEAQDLSDFEKEPPSTKILDNYNKKKQATDPDMPCVHHPCPCWTEEELASISASAYANNQTLTCDRVTDPGNLISISTIDQANDPLTLHLADVILENDRMRSRCRYRDPSRLPPLNPKTISMDEAQSCFAAIDLACDLAGQP